MSKEILVIIIGVLGTFSSLIFAVIVSILNSRSTKAADKKKKRKQNEKAG
jgi:hypothetical protein